MISHRSEISKRSITGQINSYPIIQTERRKQEMKPPPPPPPRQALLLESSLESSSRPPPAAAATNTVSHSHQQKAIACTSERAKQIIESREYHQPSRTNQSILSHWSGAHQPQCQRRSNRSAPQWVCVVCAPQRKSTPGQPHMANLKLPYDTRVAQQPEHKPKGFHKSFRLITI